MTLFFNKRRYLLVFVLLFFSKFILAQSFIKSNVGLIGVMDGDVVFADFNNDGNVDLFITGGTASGSISALYKNDGSGNFAAVDLNLPSTEFGTVDVDDYDGDGLVDMLMVVAGPSILERKTILLKNRGNFIFEAVATSIPDLNYRGVGSFSDYDNDGDPDVLIIGSTALDSYHEIYENTAGSFSGIGLKGKAQVDFDGKASWNDYDADGDTDYIVTDHDRDQLVIYKNDGLDRFSEVFPDLPAARATDVQWVNINNDGLADLIVSGHAAEGGNDFFRVLLNQGNDSFREVDDVFEGFSQGETLPIDIDQDGDMDLLVAGKRVYGDGKILTLLYINSNGSFNQIESGLPSLRDASIAAADVDHDNDLDIAISGGAIEGNLVVRRTYLYLNAGTQKNTRPAPPLSANVQVAGQKATIRWEGGHDQETPAGGLTYNVYVGTSAASYDIVMPLATSVNQKTQRAGNAGYNNYFVVENLAPGTYYYRIQTVDGGQNVSELSGERSFAVLPEAPDIEEFFPAVAREGDTVYIKGKNFLRTSSVTINDVTAPYHVINSSSIRVIVPAVRHSGKINVFTPLGSVSSNEIFCEEPRAYPIVGDIQPCFGDIQYNVQVPVEGVNYHWSIDGDATIIHQVGSKATVRLPRKGTFNLQVFPASCASGDVTSLKVDTRGPLADSIGGNRNPRTEFVEAYYVPIRTGHTYTWQIGDSILAPGAYSNRTEITWRKAGLQDVRVLVSNTECPESRAESKALVNVSLNHFSLIKTIPLDAVPTTPTLIADLDGDLDSDLLEAGRSIRENTGGSLLLHPPFLIENPSAVQPLDVDNDNDVDLLIKTANEVKLFKNNGNLDFAEVWSTGPMADAGGPDLLPIDHNADGKTDFALSSQIYRNEGGGFTVPKELLAAPDMNSPSRAVASDFTRDGYPDILIADSQLQINGGESGENFYRDYSFSGGRTLLIHDFNADGKYDFVENQYYNVLVGKMSGDGSFSEFFRHRVLDGTGVKFEDINRDGDYDMLLHLSGNLEGWLYQPDQRQFKKSFDLTTEAGPYAFLDLDNDGVEEMLLIRRGVDFVTYHFFVYRNNTESLKEVHAPTGLKSSSGSMMAELSWEKVPGYTYNVVVGTSSGSFDIVSPLADITTGKGFVRSYGNAGINNFFKLNLPAGTYYWSVQALDATGTRSGFAEWQSFSVEEQSEAPSNLTLALNEDGIALSWIDNAAGESGFLIERKTAPDEAFISIDTVEANAVQFLDKTANKSTEVFYRISALVPPGTKLSSKTVSTVYAVVDYYPYHQSFETPLSYPVWNTQTSVSKVFYDANPGWKRVYFVFAMDGQYQMETKRDGQALVTPEFNLSGLDYPVLKFNVRYTPEPCCSIFEYRVESSEDGGDTWKFLSGTMYSPGWFDYNMGGYNSRSVPKSQRVKFRIRNEVDMVLDNFKIVNAPAPVQQLAASQTAQEEITLVWSKADRATHYFIRRNDGVKWSIIDTVAAPATHYVDHKVMTTATYKYTVLSYNAIDEEYGFKYSPEQTVTAGTFPLSIQSIPPVSMRVTEQKEIPVVVHSEVAPISQLTLSVTSSNPEMQNVVSLVRTNASVSLVIQTDNYVGETEITVHASYLDLSDNRTFLLTVLPNKIPVIGSQKDVYGIIEDYTFTIGLDMIVFDDDDDDGHTLIVGNGDHYTVDGKTIIPHENFYGELSIPIAISDGRNTSEVFSFKLVVNPVNDPPTIESLSSSPAVLEDEIITVLPSSFMISDPDNSSDQHSIEILPGENYTVEGFNIHPFQNFNGQLHVTAVARDFDATSEPFYFMINLIPVDDPLVIEDFTGLLQTDEDHPLTLSLDQFIIKSDPAHGAVHMTIQPGDNYLVTGDGLAPDKDYSGVLGVSIVFTNEQFTVPYEVQVQVTPINDLPVIAEYPSGIAVAEDGWISIGKNMFVLTDAEETAEELTVTLIPSDNYDVSLGQLYPHLNFNGTLNVHVAVSDGFGTTHGVFPVTVTPVVDIPVITATVTPIAGLEDEPLALTLDHYVILNPDALDFKLILHEGEHYAIDGDRVIVEQDFSGDLQIPVSLSSDPSGKKFVTPVSITPVLDIPVINGIAAPIQGLEDEPLVLSLIDYAVSNPDGLDLKLILHEGEHYTVDSDKVIIEQEFSGELHIPVSLASDPSATKFITPVEIVPVNDPPIIHDFSGTPQGKPGDVVSFQTSDFVIEDPDSFAQDLTVHVQPGEGYSVVGNGSGLRINEDANGDAQLVAVVKVSDGSSVSNAFSVTIDVLLITEIINEPADHVAIFPNPNNGNFSVSIPVYEDESFFWITDNTGRIIQHSSVVKTPATLHVQLSTAKGVYTLYLQTGNVTVRKKLVVY